MHIPVTPSPHSRYYVDVHALGSIDTWTGLPERSISCCQSSEIMPWEKISNQCMSYGLVLSLVSVCFKVKHVEEGMLL